MVTPSKPLSLQTTFAITHPVFLRCFRKDPLMTPPPPHFKHPSLLLPPPQPPPIPPPPPRKNFDHTQLRFKSPACVSVSSVHSLDDEACHKSNLVGARETIRRCIAWTSGSQMWVLVQCVGHKVSRVVIKFLRLHQLLFQNKLSKLGTFLGAPSRLQINAQPSVHKSLPKFQ